MSKRPWGKRKKNFGVKNGQVAAAPMVPPAPVRRIEVKTLIQELWDSSVYKDDSGRTFTEASDDTLAQHLNEGWEILNITVLDYHDGAAFAPNRVVTLKRMVDVVPSPVIKQEVKVSVVIEDVPAAIVKVPPFSVQIEPNPDLVPMGVS